MRWQLDYNTTRPHSKLGWQTPIDVAATFQPLRDQTLRRVNGSAPAPAAQPARERQSNRQNELMTGSKLGATSFGVRRFDASQRNIGVARKILATRLTSLTQNGVLSRQQYSLRPPRFEYVLTEAERGLYPSLLLFMVWGDTWRVPDAGVPLVLRHKLCGQDFMPRLVSTPSGKEITAANTRYETNYTFPV